MTSAWRVAQASSEHFGVIVELIDEARGWLPAKGTSQWWTSYPNEKERNKRINRALESGATWIVWAGDRAVATVTTARSPNLKVWAEAECYVTEPAVYAHRLVVTRDFAGQGLGAELIDWVGLRGREDYEAMWLRIDVWSTNRGLQDYYIKRGFEPCGWCPDPDYPSGALLQKSLLGLTAPASPLFVAGEPGRGSFPSPEPGPVAGTARDTATTGGLPLPVVGRPPALSVS
jgi:GNAT superfamily N-acetyltransferase